MNRFAFILSSIVLMAGCSGFLNMGKGQDEDITPIERKDITLSRAQVAYVNAGNEFAFKLFSKLLAQEKSSFMVSPLSVEYALSMLCNGAAGTTQEEILNLLGYKAGEMADVNEFCKYLAESLYKVDNTVKLNLANALIANAAFARLKNDYTITLSTYYDALAKSFDFKTENKAALSYINNWAKEQTNGMIPSLLDELDSDTYALLVNAIYFKGIWGENVEFDTRNTRQDIFTMENGSKVKVNYMNKQSDLDYYECDQYKMVRLPYGNGAFQMVVALPNEGETLANVAAALEAEPSRLNMMANSHVKLKIPKFETASTIYLKDVLKSMGMISAFQFFPFSNFSQMAEDPIMVTKIFQKSKIKVDEKGSEAAAVTVIGMEFATVAPPPTPPTVFEFYATRPFMYMIREVSTGAILFMGKYDVI